MLKLFAHEGHAHEAAPGFFDTLEGFMFINIVPFVLLALVLVLMRRIWRSRQDAQLIFALAFLLAVGLLGYRFVPIASIISLVAGFGLSLALVILPFKKKRG